MEWPYTLHFIHHTYVNTKPMKTRNSIAQCATPENYKFIFNSFAAIFFVVVINFAKEVSTTKSFLNYLFIHHIDKTIMAVFPYFTHLFLNLGMMCSFIIQYGHEKKGGNFIFFLRVLLKSHRRCNCRYSIYFNLLTPLTA